MKNWAITILLSIILVACGTNSTNEGDNVIPSDLAGKQAFLKEKREELKEITALIEKVEAQVDSLDPSQATEKGTLVTTKLLEKQDFKRFVEVQGSVDADDLVDATSDTPGRIISLTVKEGDVVKKGKLIATLDLEQLKKQKAELTTALSLANTVFERQDRLWKQNIGSEIQFLEAKNNKERLEKSIETIDYQMTKGAIYAPITGVVDRVVLQSGEVASPGMPIVQILNTSKLKVTANVPEHLLKSVKRGEVVTVRFPSIDAEQRARISLIGRVINPSNRTFEIEVQLTQNSSLLKPNLLATVLINDLSYDDVMTVPIEAVLQEVGGKDYVYVQSGGEDEITAEKRYVATGESYQGEIIVIEGLKGGEILILEGARDLTDGELIRIAKS